MKLFQFWKSTLPKTSCIQKVNTHQSIKFDFVSVFIWSDILLPDVFIDDEDVKYNIDDNDNDDDDERSAAVTE